MTVLAPSQVAASERSGAAVESGSSAPSAEEGAQTGVQGESENETSRLDPVEISDLLLVTGGAEAVEKLPGSGHFIGAEELSRHAHSDIHRVLQQVEGVNVQEEDGFGMRPNIGMRGTGVNRSEKITLLEDGVLIAPAPYSAPAAYYFPTSERMAAVEVRKGSSAITQGPYTTGGVLNLVSTSIPSNLGGTARMAVGSHGTARAHGLTGDSGNRYGWLLEGYRLESDGFKNLDGGGTTGVELLDLVGKLRWNSTPGAEVHQSLELKLGYTEQQGEETYLGLTTGDFERTPYRRYAASQQDLIDAHHDQVQLRYLVMPGPELFLTTTAYSNSFFRNWHKLQSIDGLSLGGVLESSRLFADQYRILAGLDDALTGNLAIRNNRRDYLSQGLETRISASVGGARVAHEIEVGLRLHADEEDRFQEEDLWNMVDGRMELFSLGTPGSQSNRISSADAIAFYISNTVRVGNWTVTPGARLERIDFEVLDYGKADAQRLGSDLSVTSNEAEVVLPGIGVSYRLTPSWNLLGGVHRGFAAPGPGQDPSTDAEESLNHELGFDVRSGDGRFPVGVRVVGFFNDYDNLIGRDSLSVGGGDTSNSFNGGQVTVIGLEAALDFDLGAVVDRAAAVPVRLGYTRTEAEFASSFDTRFADWAPRVREGDRMPYLPESQLSLSLGLVADRWGAFLAASYTGEMRTRPGTGPIADGEGIDSHVVVDLAWHFGLSRRLKLSLQGRNLFDETYLASRRPAGLRPGLPRTVLLGLEWGARKGL